jgi:Spy/CpxP family protein refolding chaperone
MDKFRPVYIQYEKEIAGLNVRGQERLMRSNTDSLSSEEAERLVLAQLNNAKKMLEIREKYYYKFKSVLTPQQIIKLYQTEAEIRRKVMQELRRRFGGRMNQ